MNKLMFLLFILIQWSCTKNGSKPIKVENVYIEPLTITDSVMTSFPGSLMLSGNYLVWEDPFSYSAFIKVVDIHSGKQVAQAGNTGQGPNEFVTPSVHLLSTNKIGVTDLNANKRAVFDIEQLLKGNEAFTYSRKTGLKGVTRYLEIEDNKTVGLYPGETYLFRVVDKNKAFAFGKFPINEHINDGYGYYQGNLAYNPDSEKLIYCPFNFPYIISYKRSGDSFKHIKTLKIYDVKYEVVNGEIKFKERVVLIHEIALTKDYIVAAQLKEFKKEMDEYSGYDKLPQTLYLYDYDLNLQKIVDLKVPIYRLAANEESNTVYAIVANPEFSIVTVELPKIN
jgi:hypothetical protein